MAAPTSLEEFLTFLRKSALLDVARLDEYLAAARAAGVLPASPARLAKALVRDGFLTNYQAQQLLVGRYRNFFLGGKYKVLERLGQGGMASVYLCEHKVMHRAVALKVLPGVGGDDPSTLARFHREARAVAQLHHPNIVGAHDIDKSGKLHFLVMEYVDGVNLEDFVALHGPMDPLRAAHYIRQAAQGLQHAHEAGLIHRDIKPANLLVDRAGTVKILDLGLARFALDESDSLTKRADRGVILGTLDYMAPEQVIDSHDVDIRADIYSLGATFYYLLTGRGLYGDATPTQKLAAQQYAQPVPLRALRADVPEGLATIVDRMLVKDRERRYQAPAEVVEALTPWTREPVPPPPLEDSPQLSPAAISAIRKRSEPRFPTLAESALEALGSSLDLTTPGPSAGPPAPQPAIEAAPGPPPRPAASRSHRRASWAAVVLGLAIIAGVGTRWAASPIRPGGTGPTPPAPGGGEPLREAAKAGPTPTRAATPPAPALPWKAPNALATPADILAVAGRWDEATAALARVVASRPDDPEAHYRHAIARLGAGDMDGYRRACAAMFGRFGATTNATIAGRLLYACVPAADALPAADMPRLVSLAEMSTAELPQNERLIGAALYRIGRYPDGLRRLEAAEAKGIEAVAWDWLFRAMILQRLGNPGEARRYLDRARRWMEDAEGMRPDAKGAIPTYHHWCERVEVLALSREAEALLAGGRPDEPAADPGATRSPVSGRAETR